MKAYKRDTKEILRRYRAGEITRHACIEALDATVAGLIPTLKPEQTESLRASVLANYDAVNPPSCLL